MFHIFSVQISLFPMVSIDLLFLKLYLTYINAAYSIFFMV